MPTEGLRGAPTNRVASGWRAHIADYRREVSRYWGAAPTLRDFISIMTARLAQSKVGPIVCPRPRALEVSVRDLGPGVHLRSHTTDISVLGELVVSHGYECVLPFVDASPRTIVDLGANIGLAARWFAARWPDAHVVAVEPDAANAEVLHRNVAPRCASRVQVHHAGIGGRRRRVALDRRDGEWAIRLVEPSADPGERDLVDVITMSDVLADLPTDDIDLLKCDIEGSERELFASCRDWINRVRVALVECHGSYGSADLLAAIRANGGRFEIAHVVGKNRFACEVVVLVRQEET